MNAVGCDSLATLVLTITPAVSSFTYAASNTNAFRDIGANLTGVSSSSVSGQVYSYGPSGWQSYNGSLVPGQGYRAQFSANASKTVSGPAVTGNVSPSLQTGANAYSLVANPYDAVIDFNALAKTNLQNGFWYLDPTNIVGGYQGYVYFGSLTGASNTYPGALSINRYLQPGQGFFVQNTASGNGSLTFSRSAVVSGNRYNVFGNTAYNRISTGLFANGRNLDGAVVVFNSLFANSIDGHDAAKFSNQGENLTFLVGGKDLCANAHGLPTANDALSLHLYNLKPNTAYTLKLDATDFSGNGLNAYLLDKVTKARTLLVGSNNAIGFTTTATDAAGYADRFGIVFGGTPLALGNIVLAVKQIENGAASLNWTHSGKGNTVSYTVEVSGNGTDFKAIATVRSGNADSYSYTDATARETTVRYYRVRANGNDGSGSYSEVAVIRLAEPGVVVYPNPITGGTVRISLPKPGYYAIGIYNLAGQKLATRRLPYNGIGAESLALGRTLAAGNYELTATDEQGNVYRTKITVKN